MKKMLLVLLFVIVAGCATDMFISVKISDELTVMCASKSKNAVGELMCQVDLEYMGGLFSCNVSLASLKKGWKPTTDGNVTAGCELLFNIVNDELVLPAE